MQMLYDSDHFVVVQFELPPADDSAGPLTRGGYEIVDKHARREIFLEGLLAESFKQGVEALADTHPSEDDFDEFIGGYCTLAHSPLTVH